MSLLGIANYSDDDSSSDEAPGKCLLFLVLLLVVLINLLALALVILNLHKASNQKVCFHHLCHHVHTYILINID
jgi:hypothetical protein